MKELQAILAQLAASPAEPAALATLVTVAGSSYRRPGARLLITRSGTRIGSISGGCLEEDVIARAERVLRTGQPELALYDTTSENDLVWGVGLGCHGIVQVFIEHLNGWPSWADTIVANLKQHRPTSIEVGWKVKNPAGFGTRLSSDRRDSSDSDGVFREMVGPLTALTIFGAGDDAQPLARFAKDLGWHVTIADPRRDFATPARFPTADSIVAAPADQLVRRAAVPAQAFAVVMTHHYVHDVPVLRDLLPRDDLRYIGLLGPRKRAERILSEIGASTDLNSAALGARLHAPVGLDLGADTPEEVALSIIAEMRATLSGRDARPLRLRTRPIHD